MTLGTVGTTPRSPSYADALAAAHQLAGPVFISLAPADGRGVEPDAPESDDGSLRGWPFAVKDNIDVAGFATTCACPTLTAPTERHATAVERLVRAGALPVGKTNMDQFATGLVGTRSPYGACHCVDSPAHVSGGSSSGSAVAVAAGVVPFALGTDTAGSGRVPAAFNGVVGVKPTRGLVSVRGVQPACPSLDCVSIFVRTVETARAVLSVIVGPDPEDPWSRPAPVSPPPGVARVMGVVGVPDPDLLDLDALHRAAWEAALAELGARVRLAPVDVSPMLGAAGMLYGSPLVAERFAAFGHLLEPDGPHLDPVVRRIVLAARGHSAEDVYAAQHRLAALGRASELATAGVDAVLLPTTPCHPTLAEVAADPVGTNNRLGTYTNMANLLDLCAVALPAGRRADGLPFGVQLLAPAFADGPLLDLASLMAGERVDVPTVVSAGRSLLAVCGAHLSGQPLNPVLTGAGGRLHRRTRTAAGYRMVLLEGELPRPGLLDAGNGPGPGIDVELWDVPASLLGHLDADLEPPLRIGLVRLEDGSSVAGFTAVPTAVAGAPDISLRGSWRAHLAASAALPAVAASAPGSGEAGSGKAGSGKVGSGKSS